MRANVPNTTSEDTGSGYGAANRIAMGPPSDTLFIAACSTPAASMTARMSSMRSSTLARPTLRSERPVPRLSNVRTRAYSPRFGDALRDREIPEQVEVRHEPGHDDQVRTRAVLRVRDRQIPARCV